MIVEAFAVLIVLALPAALVLGWLAAIGLTVAALAGSDGSASADPIEPASTRPVSLLPDPTLLVPVAPPSH